jgi:hypothetical protein
VAAASSVAGCPWCVSAMTATCEQHRPAANKFTLQTHNATYTTRSTGCYYFGVVDCWNKYIPRERVRRVAGASAGSLIAAYYLINAPMDDCLREIINLSEEARKRPLGVFDRRNQIVNELPRALDKVFPDDAHKRVNGRLYVSMTRLKDFKSVIVNEFESKKDLIDVSNARASWPPEPSGGDDGDEEELRAVEVVVLVFVATAVVVGTGAAAADVVGCVYS